MVLQRVAQRLDPLPSLDFKVYSIDHAVLENSKGELLCSDAEKG